jgi:glycosyltransferase involved in cell wall biosynthesis
VSDAPTASIVIPTRGRPAYLETALSSVVPQARRRGAEVLVVTDGPDPASNSLAERHQVPVVSLPRRRGVNATRNAGLEAAAGELIVLIDDDVHAPEGWLDAILDGVAAAPEHDVFGGPIRADLEGGGPHGCGREPPPITTLDFGSEDRDVPLVWGANMAIRRRALERVGAFDAAMSGLGDEEEWEDRYKATGGRIRYLAAAGLEHRRLAADSRLRALARARYRQGREARINDMRKGVAPPMRGEIRTLVGCAYHVVRRRCAVGVVLGAHAAGRLREAMARRRT